MSIILFFPGGNCLVESSFSAHNWLTRWFEWFWRNLDQEITKENVDCPNKIGYDISMQRFWIRCHQIKVFSVIWTKDSGNFVVLKLYIQNVHISFLVSKKILSNPYFHCSISKLIQFCIQKNTLYLRRGQDPLTHITSGLIYNYL